MRRGLGLPRLGAEQGLGCSPLPAAAGGPHQGALPRRADRPGRALRGARAGWHVGGDPGLPPLGPELRAGLHLTAALVSIVVARGRGLSVRPDGQHWRVDFSFFELCPVLFNLPGVPGCRVARGPRRKDGCVRGASWFLCAPVASFSALVRGVWISAHCLPPGASRAPQRI